MAAHVPPSPLSLDPLIAEARRRTRQRRLLAAFVFALAIAAVAAWLSLRSTATPDVSGIASSTVIRPIATVGASGGVGWAVDNHGIFWLTPDGGRTWRYTFRRSIDPAGPGALADINQVQFVDKRHGWISATLDGDPFRPPVDTRPWAIERTVDGGRTWRVSWLPGCGCGGGELSFYDTRHGYALAYDLHGLTSPKLFWTDDGGASWKLVARMPRRLDGPITFLDRRDGFIAKPPGFTGGFGPGSSKEIPGGLYRTTDGGKTWSKYRVPPPSIGLRLPINSFDRRLVVADWKDRNRPRVYASGDGGTHWRTFVPPRPAQSQGVEFAAGSAEMWAFATRKSLYETHDGGRSWGRIVPHGLPHNGLDQLVFSSPRVGWAKAGRDGALYRTTDGGRHWTPNACAHARLACSAGG